MDFPIYMGIFFFISLPLFIFFFQVLFSFFFLSIKTYSFLSGHSGLCHLVFEHEINTDPLSRYFQRKLHCIYFDLRASFFNQWKFYFCATENIFFYQYWKKHRKEICWPVQPLIRSSLQFRILMTVQLRESRFIPELRFFMTEAKLL